ncbi:MAG: hypothetical protein ACLQQ4_15275 [Bacteroidia bacterium]
MENTPTSSENDKTKSGKKQRQCGGVYIILGIIGLAFSIYSVGYDLLNIVPLYGTVMAGVLIGALSILIIVFGYRIIKRDY